MESINLKSIDIKSGFVTLIILLKKGKVIHSELKMNNYFKKYYNHDDKFYQLMNTLLQKCDRIYLINFDKHSHNNLNAIVFDKDYVDYFNTGKTTRQVEIYEVLKLVEKINPNNSSLFINSILWWFDVEGLIDKLDIEKSYQNFLKNGGDLIYNYMYNPMINISLYQTTPLFRYESPIYTITIRNNIASSATETVWDSKIRFDIEDIKNCLKNYYVEHNSFDITELNKLLDDASNELKEIEEAKKRYENLPTWIIDYRASDGDVGHCWVKGNTKSEALSEYYSEYNNEIIRIYQEK